MDGPEVVASYPLFLADLRQPLQLLVLDDLGLLVLLDDHFHLHLHRQDVRWKTTQPREGPGSARLGLGRGAGPGIQPAAGQAQAQLLDGLGAGDAQVPENMEKGREGWRAPTVRTSISLPAR